ncbi:CU044_5270 family protein [Streptomyces sp. Tue 6430]|nr:CU044_5270 family protein [Streptomyces sp. Tue 6430]
MAAAVVAAVVTSGGPADHGVATGPALTTPVGTASAKGVPQLLDRISLAAAEASHPEVEPGQFVYIESQVADTFLKTVGDRTSLASHELHRRQIWESPDGTEGWLIDPAVNDSPEGETLSLPDEQGNTPKAHLNSPSYDYLSELTTDPDALLAKIYEETEGHGNSPTRRPSPPSATSSARATRPRSCTPPCSAPRRRSPASSSSRTPWTRWAGTAWRWPGSTRPAGSERSGSSTRRPTSSSANARSRSRSAPVRTP